MPKLTNLFLAVLLICLTLNFCTKNSPTGIDISGLYSDTIRIKNLNSGLIKDTVIFKQVTKVDDSTYKMCRFFCWSQNLYSPCDSLLLHLKRNNTIDMVLTGPERALCIAFINGNPPGLGTGAGYYDPSQQYLYMYHSYQFAYPPYSRKGSHLPFLEEG